MKGVQKRKKPPPIARYEANRNDARVDEIREGRGYLNLQTP